MQEAALRTRLDRENVPASRYRLYTIDGWAIRLVKTFPKTRYRRAALLLNDRARLPAYSRSRVALLHGRISTTCLQLTTGLLLMNIRLLSVSTASLQRSNRA